MLPRENENSDLEKEKLRLLKNNLINCTGLGESEMNQFLNSDTYSAQIMLAPYLRKAAIAHLKETKGQIKRADFHDPLAESVGNNHQVEIENYEAYLQKQAQEGAWAEDNEAAALGEKLGCNIVVIYKQSEKKDLIRNLYIAGENAPTIHLFNRNNNHWYVDENDNAIPDGNCLYNAVSQTMQKMLQENRAEKKLECIPAKLRSSIENTQKLIDNNASIVQSFKSEGKTHKEIIDYYSEAVRTQTFFGVKMDSLGEQEKKDLLFSLEKQSKYIQFPAPPRKLK